MAKLLVISSLFSLGLACGSNHKTVTPAPQPDTEAASSKPGIDFDIRPDDAEVTVDGEVIGTASDLRSHGTWELATGLHQIMIRQPDSETYRVEVTIADKTESLQIQLEKKSE